ncbi:MAG TPA: hypothetical protein VFC65_12055 [Prolixibacteraceae bacterium]|nr:hypothetical protein [Prolixibacteraceae bacterium]
MTTNNYLDKPFGPVGTSSGVLIFIIGVITTYTSIYALLLVFIGAFVGFTSTSVLIDFDRRRIKFSNNFFGIIRLGHWINIEPTMKIGIKKSKKLWRTYSRSNRTLDMEITDFRIILYDSKDKLIMPLKKTNSIESAKVEQVILGNQLGLRLI